METYPIDESLQELPELSSVSAEDLLLVSEKQNIGGVERYFSKKLKYSTLSAGLYAQFDVSQLTAAIRRNSNNITVLSGNVAALSADLYQLSNAFLSNDALTQLIPAISTQVIEISNSLSDAQPIDRIVNLSDGVGIGIQFFYLDNYAVNVCHAAGPVVKFRVPDQDYNGRPDLSDELSNITRHLVIDLSADVDTIPRFMSNCRYISDFDLTSTVSAGQHVIFTMKEVEENLMYVTRRSVLCVDSGTDQNEMLVALVYYAVKRDQTVYDIFEAEAGKCISDYSEHCYELSDVKPESMYFSHWVDTQYPSSYIKFKDYPSYYISADLVLCAIYSDVAPIMVYFYGCIPDDSISSYGPLIKDVSPQYFGVNMSAVVPDGFNNEEVVPGTHMSSDHEFIAWAEDSPYGPAHVVGYPPHWSLDKESLSSGTAELQYYVISKPIREYQTSAVLSVDDGIAEISPDNTVLELDWDYQLDTDWGDGIFFRGKTTTELEPGSQAFPEDTGYYDMSSEDPEDWVVPEKNDVVMIWKTSEEFIWVGGPWCPPSDENKPVDNEGSVDQLEDGDASGEGASESTEDQPEKCGHWESYSNSSYTWYGTEPSGDVDRLAVLLRLDGLMGNEPEQDEDGGYPISVDVLNTDTYLYHEKDDDEYSIDWDSDDSDESDADNQET